MIFFPQYWIDVALFLLRPFFELVAFLVEVVLSHHSACLIFCGVVAALGLIFDTLYPEEEE